MLLGPTPPDHRGADRRACRQTDTHAQDPSPIGLTPAANICADTHTQPSPHPVSLCPALGPVPWGRIEIHVLLSKSRQSSE